MCLKKFKDGIKGKISELTQSVLDLDDELQRLRGEYDEKEFTITRRIEVDLLRASVKLIFAYMATLIPKSDSEDDKSNEEGEHETDTEEKSPSDSL